MISATIKTFAGMPIVSSLILDTGILLEAVILVRGFAAKLYSKYPFFYTNMMCGLIIEFPIYLFRMRYPKLYPTCYWDAQFLTILIGCGIIVEVLGGTLSLVVRGRIVTNTLYIVLIFICGWLAASYLGARTDMHGLRNILLERDFRLAQSLLLLGLAGSVLYYRIPVGANLKGMFVGYGLYVGVSLVTLAVRVYREPAFSPVLAIVQPFSYVIALWIWTIALWTYHPSPVVQPSPDSAIPSKALTVRSKRASRAIRFRLPKVAGF
jgi:hypothetical protein